MEETTKETNVMNQGENKDRDVDTNAVTAESMQEFIDGLDVSDAVKAELKEIAPWNYTGV